MLRCIGFGLRPRWSSCRRSERWWSWYPAPCLGPSDSYPFPVPSRWGTLSVFELPTGAVSGGRVRYPDLCFLLDSGVSWFPGHVGIPGSDCCGSLCSISSASFWCLPGSRTVHGGAGGESRGSGGHPIALYTGSFFPLDAVPSGGRVPDLHRVPFSTEVHILSSLLLPGCASLVAVFGTHLRIRISSFPFQRLPSRRSVPAGVVYTGWPFSRLDFILP